MTRHQRSEILSNAEKPSRKQKSNGKTSALSSIRDGFDTYGFINDEMSLKWDFTMKELENAALIKSRTGKDLQLDFLDIFGLFGHKKSFWIWGSWIGLRFTFLAFKIYTSISYFEVHCSLSNFWTVWHKARRTPFPKLKKAVY